MENYSLPADNETEDTPKQSQPQRSWRNLLREILAPTGPEHVSDEEDDDED